MTDHRQLLELAALAIELTARDVGAAQKEIAALANCADARIADLEQSITIRDTEIARLETDLELARRDGDRYRHVRMMNPREFSAMWTRTMVTCAQFDELIDAARAGNGGGV